MCPHGSGTEHGQVNEIIMGLNLSPLEILTLLGAAALVMARW